MLLSRPINKMAVYLNWGSKIAVAFMMIIVTSNIIFGFAGKSIFGTYEIASFFTAIVIAFALPYCCLQDGLVSVSFVLERFPYRVQKIVDIIMGTISVVISLLFAWRTAVYATNMWRIGEVSGTLRFPLHPITYMVSFGMLILGLAFLVALIENIKNGRKGPESQELEDVI